MTIKLSNTSINKFESCGYAYKLRYIDKFVSKYKGSALCFGVAVDGALEVLLKGGDLKQACFRFDRLWSKQPDNAYKNIRLKNASFIKYTKGDLDESLLSTKDKILWEKNGDGIVPWLCLRRKGHKLIQAYEEQILPQLGEVLSTQTVVEMVNEDGDVLKGIIDVMVKMKDGSIILFDNKTTSMKYKDDSVSSSFQLGLYKIIATEGNNNVDSKAENSYPLTVDGLGYLVVNKKLKKSGVNTQVIVGDVSDEFLDECMEKVNSTLEAIKKQEFTQNHKSCRTFFGPCEYYAYCHNNGSMEDLLDIKKKDV